MEKTENMNKCPRGRGRERLYRGMLKNDNYASTTLPSLLFVILVLRTYRMDCGHFDLFSCKSIIMRIL